MRWSKVLQREFYNRDPAIVAKELLGKVLVREASEGVTAGVIVETEAYLAQNDPANHAYRGQTNRNKSMFGPPGHAYVYRIHQVCCLNAVTEPENVPSAVLIRSLMPVEGIELMKKRLGRDDQLPTTGPGKLCKAMAIGLELDGWDLALGERLWLAELQEPIELIGTDIAVTERVGVTAAKNLPLRFILCRQPFVKFVSRHNKSAVVDILTSQSILSKAFKPKG
ncbi:MAG: DNA-3-methyladenine glycosylase [Candidatus Fervidibacter sp.]|uniref:DNA-3-methyladenine glycosylase n=1 Tax=Candidatus Fervidibacter sp. TaxID=3100871 RepID=UPI00404ABF67